jgi:membrane protein
MNKAKRLLAAWYEILREASEEFVNDRAKRLAAGLAYYSLFALLPSVMLAAVIAAAIVGPEAATGSLADGLESTIGEVAAEQIEAALASLWENVDTSGFALLNLAVVLYGASILFVAWRDMIGVIWGRPYELTASATLRKRIFALLVPIAAGLVFAAVLLIELVMGFLERVVDAAILDATLRTAGSVVPAAAAVVALGLLYRYSTDTDRPEWRDVWPSAALVTAVLVVGFWVYGLYVRFVGQTSVTGAASTILVGMVVVNFAAKILLFGAEVTKVLGRRHDDRLNTRVPEGA